MIVEAMNKQVDDKTPEKETAAATKAMQTEFEELNRKIESLGDMFGAVG